MVSENLALHQLPFKFYRENGPWHCQRTSLLNWGPRLWAWEASMSHFKLPSSWKASLQSIPNRCLSPYLRLQKRTGLVDSPRMTYITRQASGEENIFQWKRMPLFQEDNVRPYASHIGDGYHGMPTHVAAHIHQRKLGLLLFPIKKETVPAWQLSIINFIFLLE